MRAAGGELKSSAIWTTRDGLVHQARGYNVLHSTADRRGSGEKRQGMQVHGCNSRKDVVHAWAKEIRGTNGLYELSSDVNRRRDEALSSLVGVELSSSCGE